MVNQKQLSLLFNTFGDQELPENERWKCIKYIYCENPVIDVQLLLDRGEIEYIDNSDIGPGFYILGSPNAEFGLFGGTEKVITFIPLAMIDKISLDTKYITPDSSQDPDVPDGNYLLTDIFNHLIVDINGDYIMVDDGNVYVVDNIDKENDNLIVNDSDIDKLIKAQDYYNKYILDEEFMTIIE